ncbi:hypothetical protein Tco_0433098 [Tanacetum coccineum]
MHTTMVPVQVKTMKIQAGVQVSRPGELRRHLQLWKRFGRLKERATPTAITKGSWGFEHTKACFRDEIIPFVKALEDLFSTFNQHLVDELSEVQNVFYQMEQAVEQHRIELKTFEVKINQVLKTKVNDSWKQVYECKDIVNLLVNPFVENDSVNVHECQKCLKLENELQTDFVKRKTYDKLFKSFTILEKHCISLEVDTQLKHEISPKGKSQEKDTVIKKLKERIKSLSGKMDKDKIKQDFEEIETINIELDHREEATVLRDLVDHIKANYPLDPLLESACKYTKIIQEMLSKISKTCPSINSSGEQLVCNGCMLSDNHDLCVLDFINNVNARAKSRSVKKNSKRKVWKPTGKVFTNIGYIWRPTGRTFTIVGNACPLTRITTTTEVPLRKSSALDNKTPKHVITWITQRKTLRKS